jgi:hypothetical protein
MGAIKYTGNKLLNRSRQVGRPVKGRQRVRCHRMPHGAAPPQRSAGAAGPSRLSPLALHFCTCTHHLSLAASAATMSEAAASCNLDGATRLAPGRPPPFQRGVTLCLRGCRKMWRGTAAQWCTPTTPGPQHFNRGAPFELPARPRAGPRGRGRAGAPLRPLAARLGRGSRCRLRPLPSRPAAAAARRLPRRVAPEPRLKGRLPHRHRGVQRHAARAAR